MNNKEQKTKDYEKGIDILRNAFYNEDYNLLTLAISFFETSINNNEEIIESYFCLGYISYILNRYDYAETFIKKVLELDTFNNKAQKLLKEISKFSNQETKIELKSKKEFHNEFLKNIFEQKKNLKDF